MYYSLLIVLFLWCQVSAGLRGDTSRWQSTTPSWNSFKQPRFSLQRPTELVISVSDLLGTQYGSCTYVEIMNASQQCESLFFRHLMQDNCESCATLYKSLQQCVSRKWLSCNTSKQKSSGASIPDNQFVQSSEATYCNGGTLSLPGAGHPINYCSPRYYTEAGLCLRRFHHIFRKNLTHPDVCTTYYQARTCFDRVQDRYCNYPKLLQVMLNVSRSLYRCWNPFCVWKSTPRGEFTPCGQRTVTKFKFDTKRGIPTECERNVAADVSDWLSIDQMTFSSSKFVDQPKKRTTDGLRRDAKKRFIPPGKITPPPNGSSSRSQWTLMMAVFLILSTAVVS